MAEVAQAGPFSSVSQSQQQQEPDPAQRSPSLALYLTERSYLLYI
jgi:hypothetical protein